MNTTAAIRRYIEDHPEEIIDMPYLHETLFPIVDYRTFRKFFSRLAGEGLIRSVCRGVYAPAALPDNKISEAVYDFYAGSTYGMVFGEALYHELGLTDKIPVVKKIYTGRLANGKQKKVLDYELTGADIGGAWVGNGLILYDAISKVA